MKIRITRGRRDHHHVPAMIGMAGNGTGAVGRNGADAGTGAGAGPTTQPAIRPVGGPVPVSWREGTLTRTEELRSLKAWLLESQGSPVPRDLCEAIDRHLDAARQAAELRRRDRWLIMGGPRLERAQSNLDAAEADLLQVAPPKYLLGQMPSLLNHVQRHLPADDPRRQEFERIAGELGVGNHHSAPNGRPTTPTDLKALIEKERPAIVSVFRGAGSAGVRAQLRVRNFRNIVFMTTCLLFLLAAGLAILGWLNPTALHLCFRPEEGGQAVVVCPTAQSGIVASTLTGPAQPDVDQGFAEAVRAWDLALVELVGLTAAAVAGAAAIRQLRGSSEPHALPVALAALKLPTGAITAVLGLLLVRGEFVPGLSALDSSGQILAWAVVLGYAQQVFTRFVDQRADSVLDRARPGEEAAPLRSTATGGI